MLAAAVKARTVQSFVSRETVRIAMVLICGAILMM
jgi:hypothetical protein